MGYSWTDKDGGNDDKDGCGLLALVLMLVPIAAAAAVLFL